MSRYEFHGFRGYLRALRPHISNHENLPSFYFFTVLSGCGKATYGGKVFDLTVGDCAFIDCHKQFSHETSSIDLWSLQWCHFFGPTLSLIYDKYLERGGLPVFRPQSVEIFTSLLDSIYELASTNDYIRDMKLNEELSRLLMLLMAESWHEKEKTIKGKQSVLPIKESSIAPMHQKGRSESSHIER